MRANISGYIPSKTNNSQTIIYNTEDKLAIFESLGVETVIITDFTTISHLEPWDFVKSVLIDIFDARIAIAGFNFRFGKGAAASAKDLSDMMQMQGRTAKIIDKQTLGGKTVSSTYIRTLLKEKRIEEATKFLGLPFFIHAKVEKGLGLGRGFGFPTVNSAIRSDLPLSPGVYRTAVKIGQKLYTGITNIGSCPTVCKREVHSETLIADFDGNLYDSELKIFFLGYLREEKLFDSVDKLRKQIFLDKERSIKENGDLKWLATGLNLQ